MNNKTGVKILATGSYFPKKVLTNDDLSKMVDTSDEWISTRTGIKSRHIAEKDQPTSELAYQASIDAIKTAGIKPEDIDLILVATITPDMPFPSTACFLQAKLGLTTTPAFDLSAACAGFVYALATAKAFIGSGLYKTVLVVGAEELSKITDWTDRNTCVLFGDGAGAMILTASEDSDNILSVYLGADGASWDLLYMPAGGTSCPITKEVIDNKLNSIKMNGKEVFKAAVTKMVFSAEKALELANKKPEDIDLYIPHQANMRIIDAVAKKVGVTMDKVFVNIHKTGNTSSATTITALDEAIKTGRVKKGDLVELVAFGGGFTWGAAVIRI